jgi:hypothetical protein
MKACRKCNVTKSLIDYAKHHQMRDGHLNICKACNLLYLSDYRDKHPTRRAEEYKRWRLREGLPTQAEAVEARAGKIIGRKASQLKYSHKRRLLLLERTNTVTELDEFVFEEAVKLSAEREKLTGFRWSVDHIVPLCHEQASGLHNAFNFQVVPLNWNSWKGNRNMIELTMGIPTTCQ